MDPFPEKLSAALARVPASVSGYAVAFSGGLDSTLLLTALAHSGDKPLRALHVDHGLHEASAQWDAFCRAAAAALNVPYRSRKVSVNHGAGESVEAAAREARYRALASMLLAGEWLLTAHHADDQLETVLLGLLRGSGVKGLRGIAELRPLGHDHYVFRPFLRISQEAIRAQAEAWSLNWLEDPSNINARFDRNYLRARVLPQLTSRWPAAPATVGRVARQMVDAQAILEEVAGQDAGNLDSLGRVPCDTLLLLPLARRRNLLRYLIAELGLAVPSARQLEALMQSLSVDRPDAQTRVQWSGGEARIHRKHLYLLGPLAPAPALDYRGRLSTEAPWRGAQGTLALEPADGAGLPGSWAKAGLTVRFRAGGERFKPVDAPHSRSLKKWLQEAGVVPWMRSRIPLLYHQRDLVAVGDLWLGHQVSKHHGERWRVCWTDHPPLM